MSDLRRKTALSSVAQACILRYESRPFSVSLSHSFGLDSSSDTVPCAAQSIHTSNNNNYNYNNNINNNNNNIIYNNHNEKQNNLNQYY